MDRERSVIPEQTTEFIWVWVTVFYPEEILAAETARIKSHIHGLRMPTSEVISCCCLQKCFTAYIAPVSVSSGALTGPKPAGGYTYRWFTCGEIALPNISWLVLELGLKFRFPGSNSTLAPVYNVVI